MLREDAQGFGLEVRLPCRPESCARTRERVLRLFRCLIDILRLKFAIYNGLFFVQAIVSRHHVTDRYADQ